MKKQVLLKLPTSVFAIPLGMVIDERSCPLFDSLSEEAMDLVKILCAIFLPPLGAFLQVGIGLHFWLNILLTVCGYVPGIVHAVWIVARKK